MQDTAEGTPPCLATTSRIPFSTVRTMRMVETNVNSINWNVRLVLVTNQATNQSVFVNKMNDCLPFFHEGV